METLCFDTISEMSKRPTEQGGSLDVSAMPRHTSVVESIGLLDVLKVVTGWLGGFFD